MITRLKTSRAITALADRLQAYKSRLMDFPGSRTAFLVARNLGEHEAGQMASSISYYAILSLFPLALGIIALLGLFLPSSTVQDQLFLFFERNLPMSTDIVRQNIEQIVQARGALGLASMVGLFWSGTIVLDAVSRAINRAWDIRQRRPFYVRKLWELAMSLGAGLLLLLSVGLQAAFSLLPLEGLAVLGPLSGLAGRILAFIVLLAVFLLLYKFMPNTRTYWSDTWPCALLAASLFEVARSLFTLYLYRWANYTLIYGSIASLVVLLVWIYYSAFILILGAEFCAQRWKMRRSGPG